MSGSHRALKEEVMNASSNGQNSASVPFLALIRTPEQSAPAASSAAAVAPVADEESIRALWCEHRTALTRFALKLTLGDLQRAEDIVQETLVRAWRHPEVAGGDPEGHPAVAVHRHPPRRH